jgi:hypothetical protein
MDIKKFAYILTGREYPFDLSREEKLTAKEEGFVVVYGASDDLMEFDGAEYDEFGCYGGGTAYVDKDGLIDNGCGKYDEYETMKRKETAKTIEAIWCPKGINANWIYKTEIPHETFKIMVDDDLYCIGLVFDLKEV